jgi:hypothetical protein
MPSTIYWTGATSGDWSVTTNWSGSVVPVTGDTVYIQNSAVSITAGLAQSAVTLAALYIDQTMTGTIGTASAYLQIGATLCTIGNPSLSSIASNGSTRIKLDFGSVQTAVTIINTASSSTETGLPPLRMIGTHASNTCAILAGRAGWAVNLPGETSTVATLNVLGGTIYMGTGSTLTTIKQGGGTIVINSAATTITQDAGTITTQGSGAITTLSASGTANLNSTGTITTLNMRNGCLVDFKGNLTARTVTTPKLWAGAKLNDPFGVITYTNGLALQQCKAADVTIDVGTNRTLSVA